MATQLRNYFVLTSPFVALWMLLFSGLIDLGDSQRTFFLYYLPLLGLLALAVYAIQWIFVGALQMDDCVQAQRELQREMDQARAELQKRGIIDADESKDGSRKDK